MYTETSETVGFTHTNGNAMAATGDGIAVAVAEDGGRDVAAKENWVRFMTMWSPLIQV